MPASEAASPYSAVPMASGVATPAPTAMLAGSRSCMATAPGCWVDAAGASVTAATACAVASAGTPASRKASVSTVGPAPSSAAGAW